MMSSGVRLGAWDYLKWKNVVPLYEGEENAIAAKLIVYSGKPVEYSAFTSFIFLFFFILLISCAFSKLGFIFSIKF